MHGPCEHSSPVRLPFGSFPVINILLPHTDILYRLTAPRVLCSVCFRVWLPTMQAGKLSNYDSEQDHQPERGSRLYGIFQRTFFLSGYFVGTERKRIFVLRQMKKVYLSFSRAGIPVIPALFFIP